MKYKIGVFVFALAFLVSLFSANAGNAHAASSSSQNLPACGMHSVSSANLYSAAGLQIGSIILYSNGCGSTRGYLHSITYASFEVDLYSQSTTYNVTTCPHAGHPNNLNCWGPYVSTGSTPVAAYGWMYDDNGVLVAYATTGFSTGYN